MYFLDGHRARRARLALELRKVAAHELGGQIGEKPRVRLNARYIDSLRRVDDENPLNQV